MNYEFHPFKPKGHGHFVFTPIRTKRFLQKGWRTSIFQQEETTIRLDYIFDPNGAMTEEETRNLHNTVRRDAEELIKNIEILQLASKTVPQWLGNDMEHLSCLEKFSSKSISINNNNNNLEIQKDWSAVTNMKIQRKGTAKRRTAITVASQRYGPTFWKNSASL